MKTASWVIIENSTGNAVLETYSESIAQRINTDKYSVVPILIYLCELNKKIKNN